MDVWSRYLASRGHDVTILSTAPEPCDTVADGVHNLCYPEYRPGPLSRLGITPLHDFFWKVRHGLPRLNADLIHCYHFYDTLAATMPANRRHRVVMQMNGIPVPGVSCRRFIPPEGWLIRRAMRRADIRITCSEFVRRMIQTHFGEDALVLAPPLDRALWPMGRQPRADPPAVLMVANFDDRRKGLRVMLAAFESLRARIPEVRLWLSGAMSPELRNRLIDPVAPELRSAISVLGLGKPDDLKELYQRASVLALPSMREPSGTVMMESWLCGTPVVASRHGGLPEFFAEGAGYLFDPGTEGEEAVNAKGLADALESAIALAANEDVRLFCRRHGEQFTTHVLGPRYEQIYRELCS